jgi:hypothetical protein
LTGLNRNAVSSLASQDSSRLNRIFSSHDIDHAEVAIKLYPVAGLNLLGSLNAVAALFQLGQQRPVVPSGAEKLGQTELFRIELIELPHYNYPNSKRFQYIINYVIIRITYNFMKLLLSDL